MVWWPYLNEDTVTVFATLVREFRQAVEMTYQDSTSAAAAAAQAHQTMPAEVMQSVVGAENQCHLARCSAGRWRRYPRSEHGRPSLDPVFQGWVRNAPGGPSNSAGTPLAKVGRGEYVLAGAATAPEGGSAGPGPLVPEAASDEGQAASLTEDEVRQGAKE